MQEWKRVSDDWQADSGKEHTCGTWKYRIIGSNFMRSDLSQYDPSCTSFQDAGTFERFKSCKTTRRGPIRMHQLKNDSALPMHVSARTVTPARTHPL